jgi:hypothetical protein
MDNVLKARCEDLKRRFDLDVTPEQLEKFDREIVSYKDAPAAIAEVIGDPIQDRKAYTSFARNMLMERQIGRGESAEYPNAIDQDEIRCYWLGKNGKIENARVEGAMTEFETHIISTENIQISLEEYLSSKYDFIPEYRAILGELLDKREDYHLLQLLSAASATLGAVACGGVFSWAKFKEGWLKADPYFDGSVLLVGSNAYFQIIEWVDTNGNPMFTKETREEFVRRGIVGNVGGATVIRINGKVNIDGTKVDILDPDVAYLVARKEVLGYIVNRALPSGGRRYTQTSPFLPTVDKQNPEIVMNMFAFEDLGMVVANSYHVVKFENVIS